MDLELSDFSKTVPPPKDDGNSRVDHDDSEGGGGNANNARYSESDNHAPSDGGRCPWPLRNFVGFAVLFALNHGCMASVLSIAPAELQTDDLGAYGLAVFYICAVVTALFFAVTIVDRMGSKWAMVAALIACAVNVGLFLCAFELDTAVQTALSSSAEGSPVADEVDGAAATTTKPPLPDADKVGLAGASNGTAAAVLLGLDVESAEILLWFTYMLANFLGGSGAGLMWSAQGPYFRFCAAAYADLKPSRSVSRTTSTFAGIFAGIFLCSECAMKVAASVMWNIDSSHGPILLFGVYTGIATLCCPLMAAVKTEPSDEDKKVGDKAKTETSKIQPPRHRPGQHKVGPAHAADNNDDDLRDIEDFTNGSSSFRHSRLLAAMRLCCVRSDNGLRSSALLLAPKQTAFGAMTALIACYVSAVLVLQTVGDAYLGYLTAIVPACAGLLQIPFTFASRKQFGREVVMVLGDLALLALAATCFVIELEIWSNEAADDAVEVENATTMSALLSATAYDDNGGPTTAASIWTYEPDGVYSHVTFPVLIALFALMGVGRASFEGSNRATYADVFQDRAIEAFAGQLVAQGVSSATAFFTCPRMPHAVFTGICAGLATVSAVCLCTLFTRGHYRRRHAAAKSQQKKKEADASSRRGVDVDGAQDAEAGALGADTLSEDEVRGTAVTHDGIAVRTDLDGRRRWLMMSPNSASQHRIAQYIVI